MESGTSKLAGISDEDRGLEVPSCGLGPDNDDIYGLRLHDFAFFGPRNVTGGISIEHLIAVKQMC